MAQYPLNEERLDLNELSSKSHFLEESNYKYDSGFFSNIYNTLTGLYNRFHIPTFVLGMPFFMVNVLAGQPPPLSEIFLLGIGGFNILVNELDEAEKRFKANFVRSCKDLSDKCENE